LSVSIANPYEENTVRLWIRDWIDEYQFGSEISE